MPENITQLIVGHHRESLTFGVYSRGVELKVLLGEVQKITFGPIDKLVASRITELKDQHPRDV